MRRIAIVAALLGGILLEVATSQAPALPPTSQIKMTTYVVGIIKKGPNWGSGTESERQRIQDGHMANIRKMAEAGKLIIAGPIDDNQLRGLFIFGISSTEEAKALVSADPAVSSGRLVVDFYPWFAAVGLKLDLQTIAAAASQVRRENRQGNVHR